MYEENGVNIERATLMGVAELTGLSAVSGVGGGAAARMGDRCFVHPHGYVVGAG